MKTKRKLYAILLTLALGISLVQQSVTGEADTQTKTDTITVTLKVEDVDATLISKKITMTTEDIKKVNDTYTVESGSVEVPVLTADYFTAANALGKYIADTSSTPSEDLTFSYGSPFHINGEKSYSYYPYWSFRVNNASPADEATGYGYTPDQCPVKDGDTIVFFRQACYDPNVGDYGSYTSYSWFDKDQYEVAAGEPLHITYTKDDGFGYSPSPAAGETVRVYSLENNALTASPEKTLTTASDGSFDLTLDHAGTYAVTSWKLKNDIPENSHASAVIKVTEGSTPSAAPSVTPSVSPSAAPSATPSVSPSAAPSVAPSESPSASPKVQRPAAPKKLKAKLAGQAKKASKRKVTFSWKKCSGADGYQLALSKNKKKNFKTLATTTKVKLKKKLKKGTWYVKVRAYKTGSDTKNGSRKLYGKYSKPIRVRIK